MLPHLIAKQDPHAVKQQITLRTKRQGTEMVREASSSMAAVAATARMFAAGFDAHHPEVDPPNHVDFSSAVFMNHTSE